MALAALVENIFPPSPSDAIIALAAFLSHRGTTSAQTVYLVTLAGTVGGALVVYFVARGFGRRFVRSRTGRRLLSPSAVVSVERGYLRFGLLGLFVARLLPGLRAFTAPFAGLIGLSLPRMLLPIGLASALWYAVLVLVAARVGENWEVVSGIVTGINRTLGVVGLVAVAGVAFWLLRRRRRLDQERLRTTLESTLPAYPTIEARALDDPGAAAMAALLLEVTRSDRDLTTAELTALERKLRARWHLEPLPPGTERTAEQVSQRIVEALEPSERVGLARRLWEITFSDGGHRRHEERVMQRAAQLLGLDQEQLAAARRRATE